jgi:hypothetical protein
MASTATQNVAKVLLKEVPLGNMASFVHGMKTGSAAESGTGCGGGCGNNCVAALDQFAHVVDAQQLHEALGNKQELLKEVAAQASQHAKTLGG